MRLAVRTPSSSRVEQVTDGQTVFDYDLKPARKPLNVSNRWSAECCKTVGTNDPLLAVTKCDSMSLKSEFTRVYDVGTRSRCIVIRAKWCESGQTQDQTAKFSRRSGFVPMIAELNGSSST